MATHASEITDTTGHTDIVSRYQRVRARTLALTDTLAPEDCVIQSMPDVSPTKWHLAHVTWFFERFILCEHLPGYTPHHPQYHYLFNSYYQTVGDMHARPRRGLLSRPTLDEVVAYRRSVDDAMTALLENGGMVNEHHGVGLKLSA